MGTVETHWPADLFADLDHRGPVPLYFQVSSRLEAAIASGRIPTGARLESETAIAQKTGLSRPTIRRAIQEVVDRGLLVRRRGIGTQVVQGQLARQVELTSLFEDLASLNHNPGTRVLTHEVVTADENVASALGLTVGSDVLRLRRRRTMDDVPVAVLTNYLPVEFAGVTIDRLEVHGLYQILRGEGVVISVADQTIGARRAEGDESALLDLEQGGPVLTMQRVAYDNAGRAVEYGHHCYRPDLYSFRTTLVAK